MKPGAGKDEMLCCQLRFLPEKAGKSYSRRQNWDVFPLNYLLSCTLGMTDNGNNELNCKVEAGMEPRIKRQITGDSYHSYCLMFSLGRDQNESHLVESQVHTPMSETNPTPATERLKFPCPVSSFKSYALT